MQTDFLGNLGIDAGYLIVLLFMIQILLFILLISVNMKYNRLKRSYSTFMKGKDGKNLEESIFERFEILDELNERTARRRKCRSYHIRGQRSGISFNTWKTSWI